MTVRRSVPGFPGEYYEADTDGNTRWHAGSYVIRDRDGTSTSSRHHPVFNQIGDGWMFQLDYTAARTWWIHESGLHFSARFLTGDPANPFDNPDLYPALAAAIRQAVADGVTGFCEVVTVGTTIEIRKWSKP